MNKGIIYLLIFNDETVYIGRTIRKIEQRINEHKKRWNCDFQYFILEQNLTEKQLDMFEPFYISLFAADCGDNRNTDKAEKGKIKRKSSWSRIYYNNATFEEIDAVLKKYGDEHWQMMKAHSYELKMWWKNKIDEIRRLNDK